MPYFTNFETKAALSNLQLASSSSPVAPVLWLPLNMNHWCRIGSRGSTRGSGCNRCLQGGTALCCCCWCPKSHRPTPLCCREQRRGGETGGKERGSRGEERGEQRRGGERGGDRLDRSEHGDPSCTMTDSPPARRSAVAPRPSRHLHLWRLRSSRQHGTSKGM